MNQPEEKSGVATRLVPDLKNFDERGRVSARNIICGAQELFAEAAAYF
jgi:hypothetical protein